jgi:hypothetical protein
METRLKTMLNNLCLLAAIVAPCVVLAHLAAAQARTLATTEAMLEHCARLNPAAADQYRERARLLAQRASAESLTRACISDEYQHSRDSTLESLATVGAQDAKNAWTQEEPG